jgi:hypothetical protein
VFGHLFNFRSHNDQLTVKTQLCESVYFGFGARKNWLQTGNNAAGITKNIQVAADLDSGA